MCVPAAMVPVPSSYQQSMAYADLHGGSLNPSDIFVVFIGSNDLVNPLMLAGQLSYQALLHRT